MMNLLEEIGEARLIGITGHLRPDGDCVGSVLATYNYIKNARPNAVVKTYLEQPAKIFSCLEGYEDIDTTFSYPGQFDVFISLDSGDTERIGDAVKLFAGAKKSICIDHHISNTGFGDVYCVVPEASSTCEVLAEMFEREYMDSEIAKALYLGIVHDTGAFQYSNTTKKTFDTLGELVQYDFDGSKIIDETFYRKTYVQNQIMGRALLESILFMDGKCVASCVNRREMEFYGVTSKDLDGIVNQLRVTKGVEVAIFMYEIGTLEYKVSMRSNGKVNVAEVALYFGGGGHVRAAGCTMNGTFYDVLNNLSLHIEEQLIKAEDAN